MLHRGAFKITDDLRVSVGGDTVQLRPADGLRMAERLVRNSMRLAMAEEAVNAAKIPVTRKSKRA